jgi:uncharacterized glyoxalase superfamily protein PhnB
MTQINPHINFNGNAEEAFTFYKSVFEKQPIQLRLHQHKIQTLFHVHLGLLF